MGSGCCAVLRGRFPLRSPHRCARARFYPRIRSRSSRGPVLHGGRGLRHRLSDRLCVLRCVNCSYSMGRNGIFDVFSIPSNRQSRPTAKQFQMWSAERTLLMRPVPRRRFFIAGRPRRFYMWYVVLMRYSWSLMAVSDVWLLCAWFCFESRAPLCLRSPMFRPSVRGSHDCSRDGFFSPLASLMCHLTNGAGHACLGSDFLSGLVQGCVSSGLWRGGLELRACRLWACRVCSSPQSFSSFVASPCFPSQGGCEESHPQDAEWH